MRAELNLPVERVKSPEDVKFFQIAVNGLKGGHSGSDIHLQRASAAKLMARLLRGIENLCGLCEITGGSKDNAINREIKAIVFAVPENFEKIKSIILEYEKIFNKEYLGAEYGINITVEALNTAPETVLSQETFKKAVDMLTLIPYGVVTMSMEMKGLVESSSNIGVVRTYSDRITVISATRSSVMTRRDAIEEQFVAISRLTGAELTVRGKYPAWEYRKKSGLRNTMLSAYRELFGTEARLNAIHAGLECGLFAGRLPDLDMASIGPDMSGVHTTEERLSIPSVERTYRYLTEILKRLK